MKYIKHFKEISIEDVPVVGGKNASLGEMYQKLTSKGVNVPDGFALDANAYWFFLKENSLEDKLSQVLVQLDTKQFSNLNIVGSQCRDLMLNASLPKELSVNLLEAYTNLKEKYGAKITMAVRSSATAEDLPNASFAGQQETFLNIGGAENLYCAVQACFASLFTDRAIKYREDNGFEHMKVALSVGVQLMVRSDKASSGVMFTLEPDTGFEKIVLISGAWGLGENVVQGTVNTDEFLIYKPFIGKVRKAVFSRKLGSKNKMMVYTENSDSDKNPVLNLDTPIALQEKYVLQDEELERLAAWAVIIENHYQRPMDIEWAKDGITNKLYIVQARPETVHSQNQNQFEYKEYQLKEKGNVICTGIGLGNRITTGKARILYSPKDIDKLKRGEILVTNKTDPDWDPILTKASAIITNQGGRTSHAAIVAREVGAIAIVGTGNGTTTIQDGQEITVSTTEGETGYVYAGKLDWKETTIDLSKVVMPQTKPMLILGHPQQAFKYAALPNQGVGLMRMEFIINNAIGIHPMALHNFDQLESKKVREKIETITHHSPSKKDFFIEQLAQATATIAAAFYPKDVIVRMSDFKSNEYANLIGGKVFEPIEQNPMIGFRGASRYYHPLYKEGFLMECAAMKMVREDMGFDNIKLMIPFCRTTEEAEKVIQLMKDASLERGQNGLELYMMVEIPSNAILADKFAPHFDGFSIGSNDLTQLTLGVDRDSTLLSNIFSPFDPAVMELIKISIEKAKRAGVRIGLCGQAPSDYPAYANFLVKNGIDSISFNPDALIKGMENMVRAEKLNSVEA